MKITKLELVNIERTRFKKPFKISNVCFDEGFLINQEREGGKMLAKEKQEKLKLKKNMNDLVDKYVKLSNEEFKKGNVKLAKIYNDMKNDILNLISICIVRNKF